MENNNAANVTFNANLNTVAAVVAGTSAGEPVPSQWIYDTVGCRIVPMGELDDLLRPWMGRWGEYTLVAYGYCDYEDEDGNPVWDAKPENFRLVRHAGY